MTEQTAAFKALCNARQNRWAVLWLLPGLQHCDIFLTPSCIFLLCDKLCTLFWLCWHPVSCVQCCFRVGTCDRAFLVQVKEAAGSSLLHPAQEEHQTFPLVAEDQNNSKTALNCRFSHGMQSKVSAQIVSKKKRRSILDNMDAAEEQTLQ